MVNHEWVAKEEQAPSDTNWVGQQSPGLGDAVVVEVAQKEEEELIGLFSVLTLCLAPSEEEHQSLLLARPNYQ